MLRKPPTDNCRFRGSLGLCFAKGNLLGVKATQILEKTVSQVKNHSFTTWPVYYVGATDCPQKATSTRAKIVLAPETEQERFRRTQEWCSVVMP